MTASASPHEDCEEHEVRESLQVVSEGTPLLRAATVVHCSGTLANLIIPVALGARLAGMLTVPTTIYVFQQLICRRYWLAHDPSRIPPSGRMPDDLCSVSGVESTYAAVVSSLGVLSAVGTMIGYNVLSSFSSFYGRKPTLLAVLALALSSNLSLLMSQSVGSDVGEIIGLVLWLLLDAFSTVHLQAFVINLFVIDLVDAESRSARLSMIGGWATLGGAFAFSIGGIISVNTQTALNVYKAAAALQTLNWLYAWLVLPESFSKEKREELRKQALDARVSHPHDGLFRRLVLNLESVLKPLRQLKPSISSHTGKRNWRLVWCTMHSFLAELASFQAIPSMIVYLTARYKYDPEDAGFLLTILSLSGFVGLTVVVPMVLRLLHPLYAREVIPLTSQEEQSLDDRDTVTGATDHLGVHIAFVSCLIETSGYIFMTLMDSRAGQYVAVIAIGLGATARIPVFKSLVVASVEPLKQGETLAAVEMVASIGILISPLVMGSILTATISTVPSLVFWVNGIILTLGASVLFLIKDSDRYQKS